MARLAERISKRYLTGTYTDSGGQTYTLPVQYTMSGSKQEQVDPKFTGYVQEVAYRDGVVAAAVLARSLLISQLRFQWRDVRDGPQGALFGNESLRPLEYPSKAMSRPRMLMLAENHVSYGGAAYFHLQQSGDMRLLRPDWTSVLMGSDADAGDPFDQYDWEPLAYLYYPGGPARHAEPQLILAEEVAQWVPEPDPLAPWRGVSWVTSVLTEILTDRQATDHLSKFYENAATPQIVFSFDPAVKGSQIEEVQKTIESRSAGINNAYKNLYVGGGAQPMVVGSQFGALDYKDTQGGHENRIALRARVPAVVLGIREGLSGSSLNAGNYSSSRRLLSDGWFAPTSDGLCAVLEQLIGAPTSTSELVYDPNRITFLQEDRQDEANIRQADANTMRQLVDGGFEPASVVEAVRTGDYSKLVHTGKLSVQLQEPGTPDTTAAPPAPADQGSPNE